MTEPRLPDAPRNIRIVVQYDGGGYVGWERQNNGIGVQQVLEDALLRICGERVTVNGAGRTDAGVHALGQVANFAIAHRIPAVELRRALDAVTPDDVGIIAAEDVPLGFHARFSATKKLYRYVILQGHASAPIARAGAYHVRTTLDVDAMQAAAARLVGRHDFRAFTREPDRADSTVRHLMRLDVERRGRFVLVSAEGDGFLYNMVRILAGTLVEAGLDRMSADDVESARRSGARKLAGPTLVARGLFMVGVCYPCAHGSWTSAEDADPTGFLASSPPSKER